MGFGPGGGVGASFDAPFARRTVASLIPKADAIFRPPIVSDIDRKSFGPEAARHKIRDFLFVLNQQAAHTERIMAKAYEVSMKMHRIFGLKSVQSERPAARWRRPWWRILGLCCPMPERGSLTSVTSSRRLALPGTDEASPRGLCGLCVSAFSF